MKTWLITIKPPVVQCDDYCMAYSENDPTERDGWKYIESSLIEQSWEMYGYLWTDDIEDIDDEDVWNEEYENLYQDWLAETEVIVEERKEQDIIDDYGKLDIVYDER